MSSSNAYILPPINAGDVFTCQGKGLMYENIRRVPVDELRQLLAGGSGQTLAGDRKESKKWFQAQCAHYGLSTKGITANLRAQLNNFITSPTADVPEDILELETEKNEEYKTLSEQIKSMTSRARSPTPGRTRRVTIASPATSPTQDLLSSKTPRSRTVSTGPSTTHAPSANPETQPEPVKQGRGRPRKPEPAPMVDRTNTADVPPAVPKPDKGKGAAARTDSKATPRPEPPSQADSAISTYSELDDEVMDVLDDIEEGFELLEKGGDGDSQMSSLPSPPRPPASLPEPRTPHRTQPITTTSPHGNSPRSTLQRDVVSGTWSLYITGPSKQTQQMVDSKGTMNLHLAEDKRSLVGEFSLLGTDGVLQSRTLEGRIDGAYARLLYVGQATANNSQTSNKVFGPSNTQSGYLRFSDGRKSSDGNFTLKGSLQGSDFGKVDFEGVRDGEEQPLCASWGDFAD